MGVWGYGSVLNTIRQFDGTIERSVIIDYPIRYYPILIIRFFTEVYCEI
jgi:hypothetical protein